MFHLFLSKKKTSRTKMMLPHDDTSGFILSEIETGNEIRRKEMKQATFHVFGKLNHEPHIYIPHRQRNIQTYLLPPETGKSRYW